MALGTPIQGNSIVIEVAAAPGGTPGTYSPCSDLTTIGKNANRDKQEQEVFMRATAYSTYGARKETYNMNGLLSVGDSGQDILRAAEAANTLVSLRVYWDTAKTDGFTVLCRVGSHTGNATPNGRVEITYELAAEDAPEAVGAGPVW